jgi:uncharacterized protein YndB with AHSA1/START domain
MAERSRVAAKSEGQELVITRIVDAPRDLVFKAWTEPERVVRWYGPKGYTMPFCKIDLRPGGVFHYCMRSPEGRDHWGKGTYFEIVAPERVVYTDAMSDAEGNIIDPAQFGMNDWPAETIVTVTFADHEGKTKITLHQTILESIAKRTGAERGWIETLDRLAEDLARAGK